MRGWKILLILVFSLTMFAGCKDGLSKATDSISKASKKGGGTTYEPPIMRFISATEALMLDSAN
jgi:hypothetical protein